MGGKTCYGREGFPPRLHCPPIPTRITVILVRATRITVFRVWLEFPSTLRTGITIVLVGLNSRPQDARRLLRMIKVPRAPAMSSN